MPQHRLQHLRRARSSKDKDMVRAAEAGASGEVAEEVAEGDGRTARTKGPANIRAKGTVAEEEVRIETSDIATHPTVVFRHPFHPGMVGITRPTRVVVHLMHTA